MKEKVKTWQFIFGIDLESRSRNKINTKQGIHNFANQAFKNV